MPRLLAIPLLALLGALAACGGSSDVSDPPPSRSGAVTSVPASPSVSVTPAHETAKQFIRRWFMVDKVAQTTGDTSQLRQMFSNCRSCAAYADHVDLIYGSGGAISTNGTRVENFLSIHRDGDTVDAIFDAIASPTTYVERTAAVPKHLDGGTVREHFYLRSNGPTWLVTNTTQVAQ